MLPICIAIQLKFTHQIWIPIIAEHSELALVRPPWRRKYKNNSISILWVKEILPHRAAAAPKCKNCINCRPHHNGHNHKCSSMSQKNVAWKNNQNTNSFTVRISFIYVFTFSQRASAAAAAANRQQQRPHAIETANLRSHKWRDVEHTAAAQCIPTTTMPYIHWILTVYSIYAHLPLNMSIVCVVCARMIFISLRSSCVVRNVIVGSVEESTAVEGSLAIATNARV